MSFESKMKNLYRLIQCNQLTAKSKLIKVINPLNQNTKVRKTKGSGKDVFMYKMVNIYIQMINFNVMVENQYVNVVIKKL